MNVISSLLLISMSIGLLVCGILFASALSDYHTKKRILENLKLHVSRLRLTKMLRYLGVPIESYFSVMPQETIEEHIKNCKICSGSCAVEDCDRCLRDGKLISDMSFCPNYQSLIKNSPKFVKQHPRKQP